MNFKHTLVRVFSDKGLLLTIVLSLFLMTFFYGKLLLHPCTTYFGAGGDGLQIYYETLFHIKFDALYWTQNSVNYPYGESIFFTGAMPFVNNLVKLFGPSAAPYGVGLINVMMIFSPVIGALFIYAIFRHLRLPWHYAGFCATFIAYLSPQILRMYGHYSLQWVFLIPAMFYLLLRFYDQPSIIKSFAIAFLVFLGASTHLYFLAFFAAIGGAYWGILFLTRDRGFGRITFVLKHTGIQFILPVVILEALVMMSDHVVDRTVAPWGFLHYHSNTTGIFYPIGKFYEGFFHLFADPEPVEEEGLGYIGFAAIIGFITIILIQLMRLFRLRFKRILEVTDHKVLNIFFWTSLLMLWFSFGHPFVGGHEDMLPYLGPLRQFRALGRFNWVFFYIINIITVYRLYKIVQHKKWISYTVMFLIPIFLFADSFSLNYGMEKGFNNTIPALNDDSNKRAENNWLIHFNPKDYQAILPLPYFHIGSENLTRRPADEKIIQESYIVSLKTGLPILGVSSARVSLSQTEKLISLLMDPIHPIAVLDEIKDKRPFLIIVREGMLDEFEKKILSLAHQVGVSEEYKIFSVDPLLIKTLPALRFNEIKEMYSSKHLFSVAKFSCTDSLPCYAYESYDKLNNHSGYRGEGSFVGKPFDNSNIFNAPVAVPGSYTCSFWYNNADGDIYPRLTIEVFSNDTTKMVKPYYFLCNVLTQVKALDNHWGLVEFPLTVPATNSPVQISVWNKEMKKNQLFQIDELLIRPAGTDFYFTKGDTIFRNTIPYFPQK